MELGLSLGDSHKFLENKMKNSGIKINGSSDLCMALSLNSWAVEETQKSQENDESDEEDGNRYIYNFQLNLLPQKGSSPSGNSNCRSTKREFVNDDEEDGCHNRKKLRLSKQQSTFLEESFKQHNALNPKQMLGLAKQLNLIPRQVEVWFQNRRARTKLKQTQTEVEWEYLKRSCEKLSEENRKLQKELKELRFLNSAPNPPSYMQLLPPTTLTLCPSCHRAASAAAPPPTITKAFPVPLSRSRFYPFSQAANQPATS